MPGKERGDMGGKTCGCSGALWTGVLVAMVLVSNAVAQYSGGRGTASSPFLLGSDDDWKTLTLEESDWDKHFALIADIDFSGIAITQVAPDTGTTFTFEGTPFTGVLDGRGFAVRNGQINRAGHNYVGLFGCIGTGGEVRNLGVETLSVTGAYYVGGLVGANRGTLRSCHFHGSVTGSDSNVGGLVGDNAGGTISRCYAYAAVSGNWLAGGLAGGGRDGAITDSYALGTVSGDTYVGGLSGYLSMTTVSSSYAAVMVSGAASLSGLSGGWANTVERSYWDMDASGLTDSEFGEGRTTEEMTWPYGENTFVDWDFRGIWAVDKEHSINNGYPWLRVEKDACGCSGAVGKNLPLGRSMQRALSDWLLVLCVREQRGQISPLQKSMFHTRSLSVPILP